ncbi:MAG: hypothetical protein NTY19_28630 [Planctomycetota bacterium]|nr:hypothetical protein [Planctomycetota bacterium]
MPSTINTTSPIPRSPAVCGAAGRARRIGFQIARPSIVWLLVAYLAATSQLPTPAAERSDALPRQRSLVRVIQAPYLNPEVSVPTEQPAQLLPSPKATPERSEPARLAPDRGSLAVPHDKTEEQDDTEDPGIVPIGQLTTKIAPPEKRDEQGRLLPLPADFASSRFPQAPAVQPADLPVSGLLQPAVSVARFYANAALVPYRVVTQHPQYCIYHDHHFRPGGPAPREFRVLGIPSY